MVAPRGHAWLLQGACVVAPRGACVVALGEGACMVAPRGTCVVALGGVLGCSQGVCIVAPGGACVVASGGHVWLLPGGMHGIR